MIHNVHDFVLIFLHTGAVDLAYLSHISLFPENFLYLFNFLQMTW